MNFPVSPAHVSPYADWNLQQIEDYYRQYPGAAPKGTGETGLQSNDETGYSDLLNLRQRYLQLKQQSPSPSLSALKGLV